MPRYFSLLVLVGLLCLPLTGQSQSIGELREQIDARNSEIGKLEREIANYQKELGRIDQEAKTLQSEISRINTTSKKLSADISLTEKKIDAVELNLERLAIDLNYKSAQIGRNQAVVKESLRSLREGESVSLVEAMIEYDSLGKFWSEASGLAALQARLRQKIITLELARSEVESNRDQTLAEREKLEDLRSKLTDQKVIAERTKKEKDQFLAETKSEEANYSKLLADRLARKRAFEQELYNLESQLKRQIDPSSIPTARRVLLAWPLAEVYITQKFGITSASGRLYASGSHNGVDFRAAVGTPVMAVLSGTVLGTGDTDPVCRGASYGKWVLIGHGNGLTSAYAHLSLIKATPGQRVATGDVIAYSGNSGYSTGPHLHLSIYASQGVEIGEYNFKSCAGARVKMPLADPKSYLDPLIYLN